jgi:2-polyprenyl-3-methyl-5-hydroxy-6-metoxy-1,4-benzoquinol methylase
MRGTISAAVWDAWAAEGRTSHVVSDKEVGLFTRYIPDRRGRVAIDAGCGIGGFSRQLRNLGYNVTGLDFSPVSIEAAQRGGFGLGLAYLSHDLDAGDPPGLPGHGIDLVVCREVLPFLADPERWLSRVRDHWLRPGGHAYLVIPTGDEHTLQRGQMTMPEIARLCEGWASGVRYKLLGTLACLILRSHDN